MLKIVTYNVNGLRQRIAQYGSLLKLLDSLDADIICFQEIKLTRQELTADLITAEGYESFVSCTRTCGKGRTGYSGVATFCRVKAASSSTEVALPVAAEEGFTGVLENSHGTESKNCNAFADPECLKEFQRDDLLKVDSEGRCIVTDHAHFVLFNIYGPRADPEDAERTQFKSTFYTILQCFYLKPPYSILVLSGSHAVLALKIISKTGEVDESHKRWELLQQQKRRIIVVGDLNIAPSAIDRCEAGPDFEKNAFRKWLRSLLVKNGGFFFDIFREKHPERKDAFTCWPVHNGAEEFNFGSRIDHMLASGECLHDVNGQVDHNLVACHVEECDIMTQFKRWKPGMASRWNGSWKGIKAIKLEGSDHVPVFVTLKEIPDIPPHSTPSLSARYMPEIRGLQQTIVSVLMRRQMTERVDVNVVASEATIEDFKEVRFVGSEKRTINSGSISSVGPSSSMVDATEVEASASTHIQGAATNGHRNDRLTLDVQKKKKLKQHQQSQMSLTSFFRKVTSSSENLTNDPSINQENIREPRENTKGISKIDEKGNVEEIESAERKDATTTCCPAENEKKTIAVLEWQRIQQLMQDSIPICEGHHEPCVARVVKKPGPNFGRRFYVCARAEGPASNPETRCDFFRWAGSKSLKKK